MEQQHEVYWGTAVRLFCTAPLSGDVAGLVLQTMWFVALLAVKGALHHLLGFN